jgi:hypothetical protein
MLVGESESAHMAFCSRALTQVKWLKAELIRQVGDGEFLVPVGLADWAFDLAGDKEVLKFIYM